MAIECDPRALGYSVDEITFVARWFKMERGGKFMFTLPETNIAPENWGLKDDFPIGKASL